MPTPPSSTFAPDLSYWQIGREKVAPATAAATLLTMPTMAYAPDDKPQWIIDKSLRGSYGATYGMQQGALYAEHSVPASPVYGDTIGLPLYGLFGDYVTTGTAASPTTTLNGALATTGLTSVTVTLGSGFTANQYIQIDVGQNAEVVQVASISSNVLTLVSTTPTRFTHLTGVAVTGATGPYTHQFALLGGSGSTGNVGGEPPSMTINHATGIPGSGNYNAVQYLYGCFSDLNFSGKAMSEFLQWDGKLTSYSHAYPGSAPVAAFTGTKAMPAWLTTQTIAGSAVNGITDWSTGFSRVMDIIETADGTQAPYALLRGTMTATFKLTYNPVISEAALLLMLNNTQPTFVWTVSNGLSGTSEISFTITAQMAGYKGATLKPQKTRWGWDVTGELISNSTNVGNSGGYGPAVITLINNIPTY